MILGLYDFPKVGQCLCSNKSPLLTSPYDSQSSPYFVLNSFHSWELMLAFKA